MLYGKGLNSNPPTNELEQKVTDLDTLNIQLFCKHLQNHKTSARSGYCHWDLICIQNSFVSLKSKFGQTFEFLPSEFYDSSQINMAYLVYQVIMFLSAMYSTCTCMNHSLHIKLKSRYILIILLKQNHVTCHKSYGRHCFV